MWFCEDFLSGPTFPGFSFKVGTTVDCLNTFLCPLEAPVSALHRQIGDANLEMCPNWAVFSKLDCPTMRADQFLRDGKPKTSAVTACRSLESREKIVACFCGKPGPVSSTPMIAIVPILPAEIVSRLTVASSML